jgi:predicted RNase H-like HicB family nuclease
MVRGYYALIKKDEATGQYEVEFPDLPGCVSVADGFIEAGAAAAEALEGWLEVAEETGQAIPAPTDIQSAYKRSRGSQIVWVPAPAIKSKAIAVSISITERALRKIDAAASEAGLNRSSFIAHAALAAAGEKDAANKVKAKARKRAKAA